MQIKDPGFFSRGKITLPPMPHLTPDALLAELQQSWGPNGYEAYKTALIGADVILKKSGWTGIAFKIKQSPTQTEVLYNPFSPSVFVRLLAMGLIPLLIVRANSWKPLLKEFRAYVESAPFWGGQMMAAGMQPAGMLPPGQPGMQQPMQPGMQQPMQPGMQQPMPGHAQPAPGQAGTQMMPQAPPPGGQWPGPGQGGPQQ